MVPQMQHRAALDIGGLPALGAKGAQDRGRAILAGTYPAAALQRRRHRHFQRGRARCFQTGFQTLHGATLGKSGENTKTPMRAKGTL
jgi:hypothetical protein